MPTYPRLALDCTYHVFNRGNNRETLFRSVEDYGSFLNLYYKYASPVAAPLAHCLLGNHFHFALKTHSLEMQEQLWAATQQDKAQGENAPFLAAEPSQKMANLFTSYAVSYNRRYGRSGSLFAKPFRRNPVEDDDYLRNLVVYIHRNPQKHGLIADFREWPYSSYLSYLIPQPAPPQAFVLTLFGGRDAFCAAHAVPPEGEFDLF